MPNVAYVRSEVSRMLHKWRVVRDCLEGERKIKERKELYLPKPNPTDKSVENKKRYEQYIMRASFYPVTESTLEGLIGQVFDVEPVVEIPDSMDFVKDDATGSNVSLTQLAMKTLSEVLAFGRYGLLTDYPDMDVVTRADVQEGLARPIIMGYGPEDIINWRTVQKGAKTVLTLVVLSEMYVTKDDGFELEYGPQWRCLRCDDTTDGKYKVELWIQDGNQFIIHEEYFPTDANGNQLDFIPFTFVGSLNNDTQPDRPPMYGIAELNVKHYRNSADYEDSVYMIGQPTPIFTGLKKAWIDDILKGTIELGSRAAVPLPENATATLLQAEPNSMVKEAMDSKEAQMVALGAQLIQPQNVSRTLGEAKMDKTSQTSILAKCTKNASAAISMALGWCELFVDGTIPDQETVFITLSTTFAIAKLSPQEQQQVIANWQANAITFKEMRAQLRNAGIATEDDDVAQTELEEQAAKAAKLALDAVTEEPVNVDSDPNNPDNQDG